MTEITYLASVVDAIILPILGITALMFAKFSGGEAARLAERQFLATLVVMTLITIRTVVRCDEVWLVHTTTLAIMIVGALIVPNQKASVAV
ncbi:MAG: hypothetical protein MI861_19985 [Pirellulales bacterium]|nr:hypothetical protein [Pirellulales bacterium]